MPRSRMVPLRLAVLGAGRMLGLESYLKAKFPPVSRIERIGLIADDGPGNPRGGSAGSASA